MSEIARFLAWHAAIGFALSTGFVALLLLTGHGGLGSLLRDHATAPLPLALLWGFTGLTFGAAQACFALWLAAED